MSTLLLLFFFFFNDTSTTEIYTLSLHDALPISPRRCRAGDVHPHPALHLVRSEEHTSELQSRFGISYAVFCLKKKKKHNDECRSSWIGTPRLCSDSVSRV